MLAPAGCCSSRCKQILQRTRALVQCTSCNSVFSEVFDLENSSVSDASVLTIMLDWYLPITLPLSELIICSGAKRERSSKQTWVKFDHDQVQKKKKRKQSEQLTDAFTKLLIPGTSMRANNCSTINVRQLAEDVSR